MKKIFLVVAVVGLLVVLSASCFAGDPVPLDCDPSENCKPIDPCKLAPERCKEPTIPTTPPPKPEPPKPEPNCRCIRHCPVGPGSPGGGTTCCEWDCK